MDAQPAPPAVGEDIRMMFAKPVLKQYSWDLDEIVQSSINRKCRQGIQAVIEYLASAADPQDCSEALYLIRKTLVAHYTDPVWYTNVRERIGTLEVMWTYRWHLLLCSAAHRERIDAIHVRAHTIATERGISTACDLLRQELAARVVEYNRAVQPVAHNKDMFKNNLDQTVDPRDFLCIRRRSTFEVILKECKDTDDVELTCAVYLRMCSAKDARPGLLAVATRYLFWNWHHEELASLLMTKLPADKVKAAGFSFDQMRQAFARWIAVIGPAKGSRVDYKTEESMRKMIYEFHAPIGAEAGHIRATDESHKTDSRITFLDSECKLLQPQIDEKTHSRHREYMDSLRFMTRRIGDIIHSDPPSVYYPFAVLAVFDNYMKNKHVPRVPFAAKYVFMPGHMESRKHEYTTFKISEVPENWRRPLIVLYGNTIRVANGPMSVECSSIQDACLAWLIIVCTSQRFGPGRLEDDAQHVMKPYLEVLSLAQNMSKQK